MLARAQTAGWQTYGYERREHHVQRCCLQRDRPSGRAWTKPTSVRRSTDAASWRSRFRSRTWRAPGRVSRARVRDGDEIPSRIVHAMRTRPFLIGGTDRFDSVLIEETDGRAIAKIGAEGVHSRRRSRSRALASRSRSTTARSARSFPAVLRVLQLFDVLPASLPPRLEEFFRRPVRNTRGEIVGEIRLVRLTRTASESDTPWRRNDDADRPTSRDVARARRRRRGRSFASSAIVTAGDEADDSRGDARRAPDRDSGGVGRGAGAADVSVRRISARAQRDARVAAHSARTICADDAVGGPVDCGERTARRRARRCMATMYDRLRENIRRCIRRSTSG